MARRQLPFASLAVVSRDDPFCTLERAQQVARDWGSEIVEIGARGHINGDSGLGDWPAGLALLERIQASVKR